MNSDKLFQGIISVKPDSDKIIYCMDSLAQGDSSIIRPEEILGMLKYLIDHNLISDDRYRLDIPRLIYLVREYYGIDISSIIIRRRRTNG